jgi:hypothetical protein
MSNFIKLYTLLGEHRRECKKCRPKRLCLVARVINKKETSAMLHDTFERIRQKHAASSSELKMFDLKARLGGGWEITARVEARDVEGAKAIAQQFISSYHPQWNPVSFSTSNDRPPKPAEVSA